MSENVERWFAKEPPIRTTGIKEFNGKVGMSDMFPWRNDAVAAVEGGSR